MKQLFTPMAAHVGNMVRNRARGHLVPRPSARSLLAALKERLPDLASLSAGVRRGARTGALALAALAASVPGTGWASAGCDYLDANVLSSVTGTTLTGDFNTDPNPSLSAPNPFTAGAANFVSGDTVLYAYANLSNARATVRRAPSTGGFVTLVNGATVAGNGSYSVIADHTRFFVVTQVSTTGAGSVDFRMYCEIATTQAVASITATVGSGVSVTPVTAAYGSGARSYAVSPALPTGLNFNTSTGAITGTPTATSAATTYTVTASYTGGIGTSSKTFALTVNPPPPTVTAVSPTAGPTGGGTTVTITGTGFSIANSTGAVMFGANPATYTIDSNTQITATAPAGSVGTVDVTVTTPGGTSTTSAADRYTYVAAPTVNAVSPIAGPTGGGTTVTITGTGFAAAASTGAVKFGAAIATYTINSNTQITATSPANAASTYDVTVTTPGGTSAISAADQFTYVAAPTVTSISPTAGPTSGGTTVTITGTGFLAADPTGAVKFGASIATYTINSNTQITATSPASPAGTFDLTVATPGGTSATSAADQYTYVAAPVASSFTASAVAYNGTGLTFSIAGHATNSPTSFAVGSATTAQGGSVSVNAAGLVTYDAPSGFRGNDSFTFTATNLGGTSAPATVTVPVSNPTLASTLAGSGTRGAALSGVQINTSGGRATYSCSTTLASGALPLGTQLNSDCTVTGTPAASGNFTFTANVTDSSLGTGPFTQATGSLTLSIAAPTVTLSPAAGALPGATVGTGYSQSFTGGGGTPGYTFAVTGGALPTGLTLSPAGALTGTPTATGPSNFDVTVTDGSSVGSGGPYTRMQSYSISVVSGGQTISFAALPNASLSASPLTLTATATSGLTVAFASTTTSVCTVSGTTLTLLQTGSCSITASQAGDTNWTAASDVSHSFTVTPANLVLATGSASGLIVGGSYSQANTASGGLTPYTYSLNAGAFVPGTTLGSDGTVSGSPTVAGSFSYQIKVTDGQGTPVTTIGSIVTVMIAKGNQAITFASTAPTGATVGGATYAVSATTNGSLVVAFSSATPAVCTVSGNTVSMVGTGTCTINADQAGDTNWNPAAQVQQSFTVGAAGAVTASLSFSSASLGVGSTGTLTITLTNPNSSATPSISPLLGGTALLSRVSGAPGGSCGASGADSGANYQFNPFSVAPGTCTVTLSYTGITPGSASGFVLAAFTPSGYPTTGATNSASIAVVPTVTGVSPPSGPVSQVVTVSGTGFSTTPGNNTVTFGSAGNGTVTAASPTSLTVTTPGTGSGAVNLTVTVNGQTSTNSVAYTFIDKPIAANKPGVVIPYGSTGTPIDLSGSITGGPHSSIAIGTAASHGTTSIAGDVVTYTPTAGYFGTDSFTYTATGAGGTSNVATVSLTVATPTAPTVADKNAPIPYNSTGTAIDLAPSISGVYSTIAVATGPQHGTVTIAGAVVTYTPTTNYYGADSFTYTATGPGGTSALATVTLAVATPPAPVAANKSGVGVPYASTGTAIDLSASVTGVHSSIAIGTAPAHGTVTIAGDVVTYTPNPATYYGADSFTYTATGPGGTSAPATVSLTVATPAAPTVTDKNGVAVPYASTGTAIDLSASVTGVHSSIAIGTAPAHGTVTIAGDVVTYTPAATYYGADSFTFTATGPGGTSAPATVTLTVATPAAPVAANKSGVAVPYASTGTAIDLSASVTGVHSSIAVATGPAHGTVSVAGDVVTYTPNPATYYGADSFTYTATGPGGTSAPATVSLTVATPAAPVAANKSGVAVPYASTGTAIDLSASVTGVHSSIAIGTAPAHGTVTIAGDVVTYTPNPATYYGADSFTYTATGPGGTSAPATVSLTVATPPAPTVANKSGVAVPYASTGTAIDLSASVTGVHSSIAIGTAPAHGTVTIAGDVVTYTPNPATYYGADSFTFTATGPGGTSAPATVSLTVATPAAPTAANKSGVAIGYNSSGTPIDLAPSVTGVHSMLTVVTAPAHGTTTVNGDVVTYTPTSGYFGADSFTYTVTGPGGTSAAATVSLTVATPPPPNAGPGASTVAGSTTTAGTSVQINLSALVTGVYDSIQLASQPAHGTVTLSGGAGPSLTPVAAAPTSPYIATYTPAANFAGTDSFTYVAVGPGGASAPGTVTITVVGQVPVAAPKTATAGDGQMVSVMLTDGAARGPFTGANVVSISPANSATTAIVAAGNGAYRLDVTPNNRFGGQIVVAYTLSNVFGASAPSTVTLTVQARPDPRNDPDIAAISDAQAETTRRFARAQVSNFMRRAEQLHNGGGSAGLAMGVTLASRDGSAPMQRPDDKNWGLAITERMRVSGEDPAIGRVVNNPQSPLSRGDQLGSGRTMAGTGGGGVGGADGDERAAPGKGAVDEDGNRRIGSLAIWAGGAIDIGTRDRRTDRSKITATTAGLSAGADIKLSESVLVGLGGGYGNDLSRIGTAAQVRGTSTIYAAYASVQPASGTFIDGMIGRGQLDFTTRRIAQAVNATARGSRDGSYTIAAISLGIDRAEGPLQWSIYGRGEYMDADLDAYAESGAGRYNLRFDARQVRSITGTIGGRLQYRQKTDFGSITPRLRVEWNHEFANVDAQWLDYADIPGAAIYALAGNGWRREQLQLSFGTRFDILSSGWSFDFETGLRAAQGEKAGTLQLRLSKRW